MIQAIQRDYGKPLVEVTAFGKEKKWKSDEEEK